jgi:uncharacterized protein DUF3606
MRNEPQRRPPAPPPPPRPADEQRLAGWAEQLGVTPQELRSALEEVGPLVLD